MPSIGWLHFADLHDGAERHGRLWPSVREVLFDDLADLHERCGPWDIVLFSGDLTQHGSRDDFAALDTTLGDLWQHLRGLGSTPHLLAVPGNYDLVHPDGRSPEMRLMSKWVGVPDEDDDFWTDPASPYRAVVEQAFAPYSEWIADHPLCTLPRERGMLPGDFSCVLEKDGLRLGVVGLNSAFLQLTTSDVRGRLAVDVRQFNRACGGDGPAWMKRCDLALLMTHHSPDWLAPLARQRFDADIARPGRFAAHLFGHHHPPFAGTLSVGGADPRRQIPGRSLFGLEVAADGSTHPPPGYVAGRICVDGSGEAGLRLWPRVVRKHQAGHPRFVPDPEIDYVDGHGTRPEIVGTVAPRRPAAGPGPARVHVFSPASLRLDPGSLAVICAPPGFGKTDLLDELERGHGERTLRLDANPCSAIEQFERALQQQYARRGIHEESLDERWLVLVDDLHALDQLDFVRAYKNRIIRRACVAVATVNPEFWRRGTRGSAVHCWYVARDPSKPLRPPLPGKLRAFLDNLPEPTREQLRAALRGVPAPELEQLCVADRSGRLALDYAWSEALRMALEVT